MSPQPLPQAGWYPDPADAAMLRWWDGRGWTAHVRTRPAPTPAPAPPQHAAPHLVAADEGDVDVAQGAAGGVVSARHEGRAELIAAGCLLVAIAYLVSLDLRVHGAGTAVPVITAIFGWLPALAATALLRSARLHATGRGIRAAATASLIVAAPLVVAGCLAAVMLPLALASGDVSGYGVGVGAAAVVVGAGTIAVGIAVAMRPDGKVERRRAVVMGGLGLALWLAAATAVALA